MFVTVQANLSGTEDPIMGGPIIMINLDLAPINLFLYIYISL